MNPSLFLYQHLDSELALFRYCCMLQNTDMLSFIGTLCRDILLTSSFLLSKNNPTTYILFQQGHSMLLMDSFQERSAESKVLHSLPVTNMVELSSNKDTARYCHYLLYTLPVIIFKTRTKAHCHVGGKWQLFPCWKVAHIFMCTCVYDAYMCAWVHMGRFLCVRVCEHNHTAHVWRSDPSNNHWSSLSSLSKTGSLFCCLLAASG